MKYQWLCNTLITITVFTCKFTIGENINKNSNITNHNSETDEESSKSNSNKSNLKSLSQFNETEEFLDSISNQPHSRKKRLIWITDDGRLALPPGTSLTISPTIALPLVRYPPEGFFSNLSISLPLTIDFDKLGLTDNQNPFGDLPPIFARSFGRAAGHMLGDYLTNYMQFRKFKRDVSDQNEFKTKNRKFNIKYDDKTVEPEIPSQYKHAFHGGERVLLYGVVEDLLSTFGINGKACLLRTICEIHSRSIDHYGLLGEITKLFLTASSSPFAQHITEYVEAEQIGRGQIGPGECFPYYKECPKSIFRNLQSHHYSEDDKEDLSESLEEISKNTLTGDSNRMINNERRIAREVMSM